jgi:hypothetical protein
VRDTYKTVTLPQGFPTLNIPLDHDTGLVRNVTE